MSEPSLREQAISALAAIREPRAVGELRKILEIARAGFASRDTAIVTASARAAGNLLTLATVKADDVHDQAASLLADPGSPEEARAAALETSNDIDWNSAAMRSLGRLGAVELAPQFLEIARNTKNPLAPSALIALGDLHEAKALESLLALNDARLDGALAQSVRDARLEGTDLLGKIEKLLRERKVRLTLP